MLRLVCTRDVDITLSLGRRNETRTPSIGPRTVDAGADAGRWPGLPGF